MTVTLLETRHARPRALNLPGKYLSLTTYRRDGSPVATPVWFVEDEGRRLRVIDLVTLIEIKAKAGRARDKLLLPLLLALLREREKV